MNPRTIFTAYSIGIAFIFTPFPAISELIEHHGAMVPTDSLPSDCIVCHDGTIARSVGFCLKECLFSGAHAISKAYPPPGKENHFRPAAALVECGITLHNGTVVCTSCHNLKNQEGVHLAVTICGSRLCLSCHIQ